MRLLRRALLRPALQHARFCSAGKASPPAQPKPAVKQAAQHAVVTSTHIFRISNPEAFMDPSKRVSWIVTGVVAALLAARFGYALYQDDGEFFESKPAPAPSDVRKTLPDGRWARCADTRATPQPYRNCHTCGVPVPASCVPRAYVPAAQGSSPRGPRVRCARGMATAATRLAALGFGARRPLALHTAPRTLRPQEAHEGRLHPEGLKHARLG